FKMKADPNTLETIGAVRLAPTLGQYPFPPEHPRALPIWPVPSGFAINTVFYAVVLWGLWLVPGFVRRRIRVRRGRCAKCGYDLRASTTGVCPECGKAAKS